MITRRLILAPVILLVGCATSGPVPPEGEGASGTPVPAPPPVVRVMVDPASNNALLPRLQKATSESGIPATFMLSDAAEVPVDFTVKLLFDVRELPLKDVEHIWGMTSAILLTMYPATCNRYRFSLTATVEDATGTEIKAYSVEDVDTAFIWLLMGPSCGSPEGLSGTGVGDKAGHLLASIYRRMQQDRIFDPRHAAALAEARGPLVYVTANRAAELVEQGFRLDDSPLRITFDSARAAEADYALKLELSFAGGEFSGGRALLAIMTIGLTGGCSLTTATLEGSLFDRDGRLLDHYRETERWQANIESNCAIYNETDKPEVIRRMARSLHAEVAEKVPLIMAGATQRQTYQPLVRIVTNVDRSAVEAVTIARQPFARVSMDESPAVPPDYVLNLAFHSEGGGSRLDPSGSVASQVAWGFMFGLSGGSRTVGCKTTTHVLDADLADRDGRRIANYHLDTSAIPRTIYCKEQIQDRPDVAEDLLRSLYRDMLKDPAAQPALRKESPSTPVH